MICSKLAPTKTVFFFQPRLEVLLEQVIYSTKEHYRGITAGFLEIFYNELYEFTNEFHHALNENNLSYITKIIDLFYTKWLRNTFFPFSLTAIIENIMTAAIGTVITSYLCLQLTYITHYSIAVCGALILASIHIQIRISTLGWHTTGTLRGGLFSYRMTKSRSRLSGMLRPLSRI